MDIITQRFIAIGNKVLAELRRVGIGIEKQTDAIDRYAQTQEQQAQTPPVIRAEFHLPQADVDHKKRGSKYKKWLHPQTIVQALTLIAVVYYACYAKKQWDTMNNTYREIQQQTAVAQSSQRAWITVRIKRDTNKDGTFIYKFTLMNIGKTPTNGFELDAKIVPQRDGYETGQRQCKTLTEEEKTRPDWFYEFSILPGDNFVRSTWIRSEHFQRVEISKIRGMKDPEIDGCVVYRTQFDPPHKVHKTEIWAPLDPVTGEIQDVWTVRAD